MYKECIDGQDKQKITLLRQKIEKEIEKERQNGVMPDQNSRRSNRVSRNSMHLTISQNKEEDKIGFVILIRWLRDFKKLHNEELYKYELLDFDQNSNSACKVSSSGKSNKRVIKMERIKKEQKGSLNFKINLELNQKSLTNNMPNITATTTKHSNNQVDPKLVPNTHRSLFRSLKIGEFDNSDEEMVR